MKIDIGNKKIIIHPRVDLDLIQIAIQTYLDKATPEMINPEKNNYNHQYKNDTGMAIKFEETVLFVYCTHTSLNIQNHAPVELVEALNNVTKK